MSEQAMLPVYAAILTDAGGRNTNEDAAYSSEKVDKDKLEAHGYLYIVADGTGGQEGGQTASSMATAIIGERYYDDQSADSVPDKLRSAVETAHEALYQLATRVGAWSEMSTTVVAALVKGDKLYVSHVGDSRAYLVREGQVRLLTRDHVWLEDDENYGSLTRWLGGRRLAVEVEVNQFELQEGDKILLCSDGLTNVADKSDIRTILSQSSVAQATQQLIQLANQRGTSDNVSTAVLQYGGPAPKAQSVRPSVSLSTIAVGLPLLIVVLVLGLVLSGGSNEKDTVGFEGEDNGALVGSEPMDPTPTLVQKIQLEVTSPSTPASGAQEGAAIETDGTPTRVPTSTPRPLPTSTNTPLPQSTRVAPTPVVVTATPQPAEPPPTPDIQPPLPPQPPTEPQPPAPPDQPEPPRERP